MDGDVKTVHNAGRRRYELYVGDELASLTEYRPEAERWIFDHTETAGAFRGRGLAARVVAFALDDVRTRGVSVVPRCWFVADFIEANPGYRDLVADAAA